MTYPEHSHEAFPSDVLERTAHLIADLEAATGTEIRLSIRDLRDAGEADLSLHELARKEFETLRLHHNDDKLGILLLILYHERKFYVYGDEGVHSKVHPEAWTDVAKTLGEHFAKGDFEGGLKAGLKKIEHHLVIKK
ncbi:MAG TPA: TPM domain-containing protein [Candidatus Kapabacteria bacterium]